MFKTKNKILHNVHSIILKTPWAFEQIKITFLILDPTIFFSNVILNKSNKPINIKFSFPFCVYVCVCLIFFNYFFKILFCVFVDYKASFL